MPESESFRPEPEKPPKSVEFDRANYPEWVACMALPSLDNETVSVELDDIWGDRETIEGIPAQAVKRLNMPRIGPNVPEEVHSIFEQGIGLALLACRQEELEGEAQADLDAPTKVIIPTLTGDTEITVRRSSLARKH